MALQGSGAISFDNLRSEYSNTGSIALSEMYRGGSFVANHSNNGNVPTSGTIKMSNFYSQNNTPPYADWSTTQTTGLQNSGKSYAERGYLAGSFGSMDDTTVDGQNGTTISAAYYRLGVDTASFLKLTLANGSDNWANFVVNGTSYSRTSASKSGTTWTWGNGTSGTGGVANPYPSGSAGQRISIAINI